MTDTNLIELTPFRAGLTRALARRGERLLAAADPAAAVADLEPLEAYYIIREIGLDQALPVLLQLHREQLETCIDIDCWTRNDFSAEGFDQWLVAYARGGPETLARAFYSLEYVIQMLYLSRVITVYDPDSDEVPPVDDSEEERSERPRVVTPDGFYLLEAKPGPPLKIHPFTVLDALYRYDPDAAHQLLRQVRVDLSVQIEEEALRFRNGRMEEMGFASPDDAAVLFSRPSVTPAPFRGFGKIEGALTRLPSLYAGPLAETSLLERALSLIEDREILSALEQEIVWTINSAVIAYGETVQEIEQISEIAERVRDTTSLGLWILLAQEDPDCIPDSPDAAVGAVALLNLWSIADLFRHGFAATIGLRQEARQAMEQKIFWDWFELPDADRSDEPEDRLAHAFVGALLGRHPLRGGYNPADMDEVKAFTSVAAVDDARKRLRALVGRICG